MELEQKIRLGNEDITIRTIGDEIWVAFEGGLEIGIHRSRNTRLFKPAGGLTVLGWNNPNDGPAERFTLSPDDYNIDNTFL
jgi:hypothetical protein